MSRATGRLAAIFGALAIAVTAGLAVPSHVGASGKTFTVDTGLDSDLVTSPVCVANATPNLGKCTLRQAVTQTNADTAGDTIVLPARVYTLTDTGAGDLNIGQSVTVTGAGASTTQVKAGAAYKLRLLLVGSETAITVAITGVTFGPSDSTECSGGGIYIGASATLNLTSSDANHNGTSANACGDGGGIWNSGTLNATNIVVDHNVSEDNGGGIGSQGTINLSFATITNNTTADVTRPTDYGDGGGLENNGTATVTDTLVSGNSVGEDGGGIADVGCGTTNVFTRVTVTNNTADGVTADNVSGGGGIYEATDRRSGTLNDTFYCNGQSPTGGSAVYTNLIVDGNAAPTASGDGIVINSELGDTVTFNRLQITNNTGAANGGGVYAIGTSTASVVNATITADAATHGGGVAVAPAGFTGGLLTLLNDTINGDGTGLFVARDDAVAVHNTIISQNAVADCVIQAGTTITDVGHNILGTGCTFTAGPGDQDGVNPLLHPLANNGGYSQTEAIDTSSPAYNMADNTGCPATDQRGVSRPQVGICDVGAFEFVPAAITVPVPPTGAPLAPALAPASVVSAFGLALVGLSTLPRRRRARQARR